jgi:plasmid stability protein
VSVNLSIKDVPDELAARLRLRAARNHRSLQGELMAIVEQAAASEPPEQRGPDAAQAGRGRSWTQGFKTIEQLVAERQAAGWKAHPSLARAPLAVDLVRAARDAR